MKLSFIYRANLFVLLLLLMSGCNDWLDVSPRQETREDDLYTTEEGFKSALTGAYILLAEADLYGRNTTMLFPEILANTWTLPVIVTSGDYALANFDYTHSDVEALIEIIWKKHYQAIVHLNSILDALEKSETVSFSYNNDKLIKGEALGLRAFLHFELLRYFGAVPEDANPSDKVIPYVTEMTKDPNHLLSLSWKEVLEHIEADLNAAESLLEIDPILSIPNKILNYPGTNPLQPKDDWHNYRQNRFNYYAVLGMKARFYHWIGNKTQAVSYAKKVIEAKDADGTAKFTLASEETYSSNLIMFSENLFGVHNSSHQLVVAPLFEGEAAKLTQTPDLIKTAYEASIEPSDIRNVENRYWIYETYQHSVKVNRFCKYTGNKTVKPFNIIPILRLSELYFILTEDLPLAEAVPYFKTFRISRILSSSLDNSLTDETAVKSRLEKEYRKEFMGEGQMFFFYKKHKYAAYSWPKSKTLPVGAYVVPKPKSQSVFE